MSQAETRGGSEAATPGDPTSVSTPAKSPDTNPAAKASVTDPALEGAGAPVADQSTKPPPWVLSTVVASTWRIVAIVLIVLAALWVVNQASTLFMILIVSTFLALAMVPGVNSLVANRGWSRGAATGVIFLVVFGSLILLVGLLIPAIADMSSKLADDVPQWADQLSKHGVPINESSQSTTGLLDSFEKWAKNSGSSKILHAAGSGVEVLFEFFTVLMFTFLIASNEPALRSVIMRRLPPAQQRHFQAAWNTAITQTGGYFYSRLLLMMITGTLYFAVMVLLRMDVLYALPLAFFGAFFVEFIPVIGSYIGISIPVLVMLAERGLVSALALLAWGIIYQQIHDYLLSPRISSKTMEINAGVAFGSALLGGALAGPIGALFALPMAGMVTVFLRSYLPSYSLDESAFDDEAALPKEGHKRLTRAERKALRQQRKEQRMAAARADEGLAPSTTSGTATTAASSTAADTASAPRSPGSADPASSGPANRST